MQLAKDCGNVFDKRYNTDRRPLSNLTSASVNGGKMAIQIWQETAKENAAAEPWHHIRISLPSGIENKRTLAKSLLIIKSASLLAGE